MIAKVIKLLECCLIIWKCIKTCNALDAPELFDKDQKMEKLVVKNQIAYHFKKVVREVASELFISRKVDVSGLFQGIQVLEQTYKDLDSFCASLAYAATDSDNFGPKDDYVYISEPKYSSFAEANARCKAKNMQLPEIYTLEQGDKLRRFMLKKGLKLCFAGIQPDPRDAIQRFISTGFPIWKSALNLTRNDDSAISIKAMLDDINAKFLYSHERKLVVMLEYPNVVPAGYYASNRYWEWNDEFSQVLSAVVCEPKWDGTTYTDYRTDLTDLPEFKLKNRFLRVVRDTIIKSSRKPVVTMEMVEKNGIKDLRELCFSVASHAQESFEEMSTKLANLLALVDISVQEEVDPSLTRRKRVPFLAKFIFSTGIRLIWSLFGFVQKIKMNNKIKRLEKAVTVIQGQVEGHNQAIHNMSQLLYAQSIAVNQLFNITANLDARIEEVEHKVQKLEKSLSETIHLLETTLTLDLLANLVTRVQQTVEHGYDTLENIIHCSLLGQTSPLILPVDQLEVVQNEVRKGSPAVLDPDFFKMQSVVVSDPNDPHLLLVVVNAAALNRNKVELVRLVPVPFYNGLETLVPILEYETLVLDQLAATYSVLTKQEEYDCLFNRCYVSSVEKSIHEKSCGIPQLFDRHLEACITDSSLTNGVFLYPMLPDGVIFAFRSEVSTQLFCKNNNVIGLPRKLNGTGVLNIPNGCILSVTDNLGRITKVKGPPLFRLIDVEEMSLVQSGPLRALHAYNNQTKSYKSHNFGAVISEQISTVARQVETVGIKISSQSSHMWSLTAIILVVLTLTTLVFVLLYRYSGRFRQKLRDLRDKLAEVTQQLITLEVDFTGITRRPTPPDVPPKSLDVLLHRFNTRRVRPKARDSHHNATYVSMDALSDEPPRGEERVYQVPSAFTHVGSESQSRFYPRLTPLKSLSNADLEKDLLDDSREVSELCQQARQIVP